MSQTRQSADDQRLAAERELFERLHDANASDAERSAVRDELVETHMPLVHHLARRYADRGEPIEDVTQVATIGLIQAIDKFDPERGSAFSTYAVPTILGAIRRHFRDATWSVKVPRRVQELRGKIDAAHDALAQELGRSPTVAEIAARADVDPADVLDSLELSHARSTAPIDATSDGEVPLADTLGDLDASLTDIENAETIKRLLATLSEDERAVVTLRFFDGLTQTQIAERVGVSQMQVSRILTRSLEKLRAGLAAG
ncbi:MAG: SigB/SigF/SigG family RNA polymerase sigma factor [Actinobacteria bacterium]|nr:SigB/SigF/SigG family RNA polymerase sigma factor [Actinomycetota bacterium]